MNDPAVKLRRIKSVSILLLLTALPAHRLGVAQEDDWGWAKRDTWQRPAEVMDALGLKPGSVVADVGCGEGYFTFHLASRVGPEGKVYAVDTNYKALNKIRSRARNEQLEQIEPVLGSPEDPHLPAEMLDAILVVDAFHEMQQYDAMLQGMYRALKPEGLLGIIDRAAEPGKPRSTYFDKHRIPLELVREDVTRNGFQFLRNERGFMTPNDKVEYFFLIFQKARANRPPESPQPKS